MQVFVLWQSLVVEGYRGFFTALAQSTPWRLGLAAPQAFRELGQQRVPCAPFTPPFQDGDPRYPCYTLPCLAPHTQIVMFRGLGRALRRFFGDSKAGPQVFMCMAEPYSVTAFIAYLTARLVLGRDFIFVCFAAQNIFKPLSGSLRALQRFILRRTAAVLTVGTEHAGVLQRHGYQGQCLPFPLWFASSRFFLRPGPARSGLDGVVVGFAGSLVPAKGVEDLLNVWPDVWRTSGHTWQLRLAGSGPLQEKVAARCQELQSQGFAAELLGPLPAQAMPEFFASLDILVVPSRTTEGWKEQFGRVIVEAQACGTLVVGSDSGEIPRVIDDPRLIFREGDALALVAALQRAAALLDDPGLRRRVSQAAYARYADVSLAQRFAPLLAETVAARQRQASPSS